jgi:hypothetical protein
MRPACGNLRSGGLVPTESLAAARHVEPDRKPGAGWLVIQNDWIALRIEERALAVAEGETIERGAAIGRDRCTGDVDRTKVGLAESL